MCPLDARNVEDLALHHNCKLDSDMAVRAEGRFNRLNMAPPLSCFFLTGNINPVSGVVKYGERGLHYSGGGKGCGTACQRRRHTLNLEGGVHDIYVPLGV